MESCLEESQRWMAKAHSSLSAAKTLWEESLFAESILRSYYAMFYAAKALLLLDGIDVSKHSARASPRTWRSSLPWLHLTCQNHPSSPCGNDCWPGWLPGVPGRLPCERIGAEENSV
jgi:hypothetical protein